MEPIEIWNRLINSDSTRQEMQMRLEDIYRNNQPYIAEIIMNSYCPNSCLHCIYPPDYHEHNRNLTLENWKKAFISIYENLKIKRFIFDGRSLNKDCLHAIRFLRKSFGDVQIGLITDGISISPFVEDLKEHPPDWLDVSLDGLKEDHDKQRNHPGAFDQSMDILMDLKASGQFDKINILTCLTAINIGSVTGMVRFLNKQGFKNFFITPVTVLDGFRPSAQLMPDKDSFMSFLKTLSSTTAKLTDSWIELDIYDALYAQTIKEHDKDLFSHFSANADHLEIKRQSGDNEFYICYFPSSLTGIREVIINSDGKIIPPRVMAMGKIPENLILGDIFHSITNGPILDEIQGGNVPPVFFNELLEEKLMLKLPVSNRIN